MGQIRYGDTPAEESAISAIFTVLCVNKHSGPDCNASAQVRLPSYRNAVFHSVLNEVPPLLLLPVVGAGTSSSQVIAR